MVSRGKNAPARHMERILFFQALLYQEAQFGNGCGLQPFSSLPLPFLFLRMGWAKMVTREVRLYNEEA